MATVRIILFFLFVSLSLHGCATVNFSANYYTPPDNYRQEVMLIWNTVRRQFHSQHNYAMTIVSGSNSKKLKGIPAISGTTVIVPDEFIRYIYQNYYNDRAAVLTCTVVHELCHTEYGLVSSPPEKHLETDFAAIQVLGGVDSHAAPNYYKSLQVLKDYWFARKGIAGHAFNVGWNAANAAAMVFIGHGYFVDWFATDISKRLQSLSRHYKIPSGSRFRRSQR